MGQYHRVGLRRWVAAAILIDLLILAAVTAWVFWPSGPAVRPIAAAPSTGPAASHLSAKRKSEAANDRAARGGPSHTIAGTIDLRGNFWLGSEGDGVWALRDNAWRHFLKADGIASDDVSSMACDRLGRIWVGHTGAGVSIFDGQSWKRYDRFSGVGGSHVTSIRCAPTDGDVWLGTENGLTRYSQSKGTWTHVLRAVDMPDGSASGIAFDSAGNIFVAMADNGVAMANAADGYKTWKTVIGPEMMPVSETNTGLAGRLVNAIAVGPDDVVYAGTCRGLAWSEDHGATWQYLRGRNWPALVSGRYDGAPAGFVPTVRSSLLADWISTLAVDGGGNLWVGYRGSGYQVFSDPRGPADFSGSGNVTVLLPSADKGCVVGTYSEGVRQCDTAAVTAPAAGVAAGTPVFPAPMLAPAVADLDAWRQKVDTLPAGTDGVEFLGDDWETTGNWQGRYGSETAHLMGYQGFLDRPGYEVSATTGPYRQAAMRYYWLPAGDDRYKTRGLLDSTKGRRVFTENNDESYNEQKHPTTNEGPDLFVRVALPPGVHQVSLYFHNFDGRGRPGTDRDFQIDVKRYDGPGAQIAGAVDDDDAYYAAARTDAFGQQSPSRTIEPELAPVLAHTRVTPYFCGVWKRFVVRGGGTYWFKIGRNHSFCAKVQGVFVDRLDTPTAFAASYPQPPKAATTKPNEQAAAATRLWAAVDASVGRAGYAAIASPARIAAYQAGVAAGLDANTLADWRWTLRAWDDADAKQFAAYEAALPKVDPKADE